jgi:hypothetical protein
MAMIVGLIAAGCVTGGSTTGVHQTLSANSLNGRVLVNRDTVQVTAQQSALELLDGRVARFRSAAALGGTPLVVLDGVPLVDGLNTLRLMRADDVRSITTMWPVDAAFRYGSAGKNGAILVATKGTR